MTISTPREALEAAAKVAHDLALQSGDDITKGAAICIEQAIRAIPVAEPTPDPLTARLVEALQGIKDDYMTSEVHHPDHVLILTKKFEELCAALAAAEGRG